MSEEVNEAKAELVAAYLRYIAQAEDDIEKATADKAEAGRKFDHIISKSRKDIAEFEKEIIALNLGGV